MELPLFAKRLAPAAGLFDVYLLVAGLWLVVAGIRINQQGQMNVGLLAVAALIIARFLDTDLSFILRGFGFYRSGSRAFWRPMW